MAEAVQIADPAECRKRAGQLRERAQSSTVANVELLEAADTWDELARHAETLRDAYRRLRASEDPR
jgi:hypothetical protein